MQVTLVGKEVVSYTKKQTGEVKEGISLYYMAAKDKVQGMVTDSLWVRKDSHLYDSVLALDLTKQLRANVVNEVPPGGRFPMLTEIKIAQ